VIFAGRLRELARMRALDARRERGELLRALVIVERDGFIRFEGPAVFFVRSRN